MPIGKNSELKTVSAILTLDQIALIEQRKKAQSTPERKVSFAEATREVVAVGLSALRCASNMDSITTTSEEAA